MNKYKIFIGQSDPATSKILEATVEKLGHEVVGTGTTRAELIEFCTLTPPQLIISGAEYPDGNGIEGLIAIAERNPLPAVIVAQKDKLANVERAMDDHVMAYLVDPVTPDDLKPTIHVVMRRFQQFEELRKENEGLRDALQTRKKMERAKGILMAKHKMSEEDAYLKLRDLATSRRIKLGEVAEVIIAAETKNN